MKYLKKKAELNLFTMDKIVEKIKDNINKFESYLDEKKYIFKNLDNKGLAVINYNLEDINRNIEYLNGTMSRLDYGETSTIEQEDLIKEYNRIFE